MVIKMSWEEVLKTKIYCPTCGESRRDRLSFKPQKREIECKTCGQRWNPNTGKKKGIMDDEDWNV